MKLKQFLNEKEIISADEIYTKEELIMKKLGFKKYKKLEDGSYEVWGNFYGNSNEIPIKIKILHGYFDCSWQKLTSLENCPEIVNGIFNCSHNKNLTSLEKGPKKVEIAYDCSGCNLLSLKGVPEIVNGLFDCSDNKNLSSLDFAPEVVKGDFVCFNIGIKVTKEYIKSICDVKGEIDL